MESSSIVQISTAITHQERAAALHHIETFMRERFKCDPPPTRGVIFTARSNGEIVGTIALESARDHTIPFEIEDRYEFSTCTTPFPFDRRLIVQGTRWTSSEPGIGILLLRESLAFAHAFGKHYMLFEAKDSVLEYFKKLAITWEDIDATLLPERARAMVGDAGMRYYQEAPAPCLSMMDLAQFLDQPA